uniref:NYN domain-containing protein n=1 Tax=Palpitomonas bilix TaxID=652834 RepID=A0A7S3DJA0_9EUKA
MESQENTYLRKLTVVLCRGKGKVSDLLHRYLEFPVKDCIFEDIHRDGCTFGVVYCPFDYLTRHLLDSDGLNVDDPDFGALHTRQPFLFSVEQQGEPSTADSVGLLFEDTLRSCNAFFLKSGSLCGILSRPIVFTLSAEDGEKLAIYISTRSARSFACIPILTQGVAMAPIAPRDGHMQDARARAPVSPPRRQEEVQEPFHELAQRASEVSLEDSPEPVLKRIYIFHDAENCFIPNDRSIDGTLLYSTVKRQIIGAFCRANRLPLHSIDEDRVDVKWEFHLSEARGAAREYRNARAIEALIDMGVKQINTGEKRGSVDREIHDSLVDMIDHLRPGIAVALISGDRDFSRSLARLKTKGCTPILIHTESARDGLLANAIPCAQSWETIVDGCENPSRQGFPQGEDQRGRIGRGQGPQRGREQGRPLAEDQRGRMGRGQGPQRGREQGRPLAEDQRGRMGEAPQRGAREQGRPLRDENFGQPVGGSEHGRSEKVILRDFAVAYPVYNFLKSFGLRRVNTELASIYHKLYCEVKEVADARGAPSPVAILTLADGDGVLSSRVEQQANYFLESYLSRLVKDTVVVESNLRNMKGHLRVQPPVVSLSNEHEISVHAYSKFKTSLYTPVLPLSWNEGELARYVYERFHVEPETLHMSSSMTRKSAIINLPPRCEKEAAIMKKSSPHAIGGVTIIFKTNSRVPYTVEVIYDPMYTNPSQVEQMHHCISTFLL